MELTCIVCPRGCTIHYDVEGGEAVNITGNSCPRGKAYCETEVKAPTRMITSTVPIEGGIYGQLPVITSHPIPKEKIFDVMNEIHSIKVTAPVNVGDCLKELTCTEGKILASRSMNHI